MKLISDRTSLIHTENAFKVGPYIAALEDAGHKVVKCNLGEPDFPLPVHIRDEVKAQLDKPSSDGSIVCSSAPCCRNAGSAES